jgi:phage-related minor tail protein
MGLSISDAANFLGNLDKNGVDAGTAMAGLKKALQNAAAEGVPMSTALAQLEGTLKSGATNTAAYQAAMELFGNKAGPAIAAAVQSGQLSFTELQGTLQDFSGSVEETFAATLDPMDQMQMTMNNLKLAGTELASSAFSAIAPAFRVL